LPDRPPRRGAGVIMAGMENWHPFSRRLYEHCRAKPDAWEDHPWGDTVFKIKDKVFAFLGHHPVTPSVTVKAPPDELEILLAAPFIKRSRYIGRYGWVNVTIEDEEALRLALDLVDDSYEIVKSRGRQRPRSRQAADTRDAPSM
jgi:predicted DNA-binding protein (MmcQ/YjbR family)